LNRSQIEKLFNNREYSKVLSELDTQGTSHWNDTVRLRCLRALGDSKQALTNAKKMLKGVESNSSPYKLTEQEIDDQLRFIALVFSEFGEAKKACQIMKKLTACAQKSEETNPTLRILSGSAVRHVLEPA